MHEDALALDEDLAARLIGRRFPELSPLPVRRLRTAGTVNTIMRVGSDLVARFPLSTASEAEIRAEADALEELAAASPVPVPRPYGVGAATPDFGSAWSVQTWLVGETADHRRQESSSPLADDVVTLISALREAPVHGRTFDGRGRGGTLTDHDEWMTVCFDRSHHLIDVAGASLLWASLRTLPASGPDVMSHRDLTPFNLLLHDDRLVGLLDGGGFGPADRALDLVAAWHLFDGPTRLIVREALGAEDVEWLRGAAWALQQAMGLVWYYEESNPAMSALGSSTLRRLLTDAELSALR